MACHYCSACHYCTETEPHTACHYCGGIYAHMSETARNASCHLCAATRQHKKQATCRANYKRSVQCSVIALLSTCKTCCLLWRYDSP